MWAGLLESDAIYIIYVPASRMISGYRTILEKAFLILLLHTCLDQWFIVCNTSRIGLDIYASIVLGIIGIENHIHHSPEQ